MMEYAGDIDAAQAWHMIAEEDALLIDVRTLPEWRFVGVPDLRALNKEAHFISWQVFPTMQVDADFSEKVGRVAGDNQDRPLLFLCRSGGRSAAAAAALTASGYRRCYNIRQGFEGDRDEQGHRGQRSGWKVSGLPWVQE
ncbi:MAG TPA: rhodanese-like domain-containing protein [Dongiaceae bacterium]|jgi:rhodanese-related sulfurtransferase|nr:rhodanese-like domain-containing protein [Dongiaceae bacterium]